jgi:hypothetical protein
MWVRMFSAKKVRPEPRKNRKELRKWLRKIAEMISAYKGI